ncbi:MAG: TIR domain-containing protein [Pseudomonadota bacterium]
MATIFINYRRQDSRGTTFALREKLLKYFKHNELFLDIEGLGGGEDFVNALANTVSLADVMVVVIGAEWLEARDDDGNLRLHQDDDFVRIEIASAIAQDKKILPVLLEGTEMPSADDLPDDLKELARRNAAELRLNRIDDDARAIAQTLKKLVPSKGLTQKQLVGAIAGTAAAALVCGALAGPYVSNWTGVEWAPNTSKTDLAALQNELEQARVDAAAAGVAAEAEIKVLRQAKKEAEEATVQAQTDLKAARAATEAQRSKVDELRDTVDDLRTDVKEAQLNARNFEEKFQAADADAKEHNIRNTELTQRIEGHKFTIVSLENRSETLCENFGYVSNSGDGSDALVGLLIVFCKNATPED